MAQESQSTSPNTVEGEEMNWTSLMVQTLCKIFAGAHDTRSNSNANTNFT